MATDNHIVGLMITRNQMKKITKTIGMKKMSDEEFEREMAKLNIHISVLVELLQEYEEDERYIWTMKKKKVRCHSLQMKLKERLYFILKE